MEQRSTLRARKVGLPNDRAVMVGILNQVPIASTSNTQSDQHFYPDDYNDELHTPTPVAATPSHYFWLQPFT